PSKTFSFPKPPALSSSSSLASPPSPTINTAVELPSVLVISVNPFEDPVPAFSSTETICQPLTPNLEDELPVCPGDTVQILQVFDGGRALVERTTVNTVLAGDPHRQQRRDLIVVECFGETGRELPHCLAQKRLSNYATPHGIRAAF
ncbi:hypothetical protein F5141DRAFT_996038, partial [Pisolithus sp. B1]